MRRLILCVISFVLAISCANAQKDFFGFQQVNVDDENYTLKWSAKMKNGRILEEFVRPKDNLAKYEKKVVLERSNVGKTNEDEVTSEMAKLALMKEQSIVFEFNRLDSGYPDEIWLEYTQGNVQGGTPFLLEWNFCRYKNVGDHVVLFRFRRRFYDTKESSFNKNVEKHKEKWIKELGAYVIPEL